MLKAVLRQSGWALNLVRMMMGMGTICLHLMKCRRRRVYTLLVVAQLDSNEQGPQTYEL